MRLNQFLARAGFGSRRKCEELIEQGLVTINGRLIRELATRVGPKDAVKVDGKLAHTERELVAVLNKPAGYVCTAPTATKQRTIYELLPRDWPRVFYVGRLDQDSEGLLLVTNNGPLAQKLTHPRYKMPKTYLVALDRAYDTADTDKLRKGLLVEGTKGRFDAVYRVEPRLIKVILTQGLKRQIRVMLGHLGYEVKRLRRIQIGPLDFPDLELGGCRILTEAEVARLLEAPPRPTRRPDSISDRSERGDFSSEGAEARVEEPISDPSSSSDTPRSSPANEKDASPLPRSRRLFRPSLRPRTGLPQRPRRRLL